MANSNREKGRQDQPRKNRKGDTSRTSSQGRKLSSGGRPEADNQGKPKADNPQRGERTGVEGLNT
jgi:hypothetical protein